MGTRAGILDNLWGRGTEEPARQATEAGGIDSVESIPELHKSLKIPALATVYEASFVVWEFGTLAEFSFL
jgi:hypothetical protein